MARASRVGQAVLAFARPYSSSGPNSARAGEHRLPHLVMLNYAVHPALLADLLPRGSVTSLVESSRRFPSRAR